MRRAAHILRSAAALALGFVVCMAVFGLILALLQALPWNDASSYKLGSTIASAGIAIISGGIVVAAVVRNARVAHAVLFGLLFGTLAFGYIFGASWLVIPSTAVAGLLAGLGGKLTERALAKRRPHAISRAN